MHIKRFPPIIDKGKYLKNRELRKSPLRLAEWGNGLQGSKVFELAKNISTKVDFENGRFCTWGSTLSVEITSPHAFKGPLRLAVWGNGF